MDGESGEQKDGLR